MRPRHEDLASRLLNKLADALFYHPRYFVLPQILLFLLCVGYAVTHLQFTTNRADLISSKVKYQQDFLAFKREFRFPDSLVAIVESHSQEKNRRFVERLAMKLEREPELFADTYYKGDLKLMGEKGLLFLPEPALEELGEAMREDWLFIETFSQATNLQSLFELVNRQFREVERSESADAESYARIFGGLHRILDEASASMLGRASSPAPGMTALFGKKAYITFAGGQIYAVMTHAAREEVVGEAVARLEELVRETQVEIPGVNAGATGEPVLNHDEMNQARRDISGAAVISVVLVAVIFICGYHEVGRPVMATLCLLVGIGYTLGIAAVLVGRLNLLSITLVPILIGLAIDFGVHLITRFEEELRKGRSQRRALRQALVFTGIGIFTSGLTTAGAFLAMMLTEFKGIQEMGLISGVGLVLCLIPMMPLLPLLLLKGNPELPHQGMIPSQAPWRERIEEIWLKRPMVVVLCGVLFTLFCVNQFPKLSFDYNLLNLQSRGLPAVGIEEKLIRSGSQSLLHAMVVADSLEHAMEMEERILELAPVAGVTSMVEYLTEDQTRKLQLIEELKGMAGTLALPEPDSKPVDLEKLNSVLFSLQGFALMAADQMKEQGQAELEDQFRSLRQAVGGLRSLISSGNPLALSRLTGFQREMFASFHETVWLIKEQDTRNRLMDRDLPPFLRERFVSPAGKFLLQVYPKEDVWQREEQERFVVALREVDPNVTGTLVQIYEYTSMLRENFQKASAYAVGIIGLLVLFHFRRIGPVLLAFFPVIIGLCWMLGLMGFIGIPFNPINIMALTLVIGIGVSNGIHILNRFSEEPDPSILAKSTGKAVLVSAFTSMAGFGSLMSAKHQGIASLGEAMAIGTGMCMVASLTFLPAVLQLLRKLGWGVRTQPHAGGGTGELAMGKKGVGARSGG
jgi:uncharacterized protein